jgi:hypothetical protein
VVAVLTRTHFVTSVEWTPVEGTTHLLRATCPKCPLSTPDLLLDPKKIRAARDAQKRRPAVATAADVTNSR